MTRQTLEAKAARLPDRGRLRRVVLVDGERIEARICGTDTKHGVGHQRGGWWCDCQAHQFGRR